MTVIDLPYTSPPLSANHRHHHMAKARITKRLRQDAHVLARAAQLPKSCTHVTVVMHYAPARRGRFDAENPIPTFKALCDGLVDYGLVPDDTPEWMTKLMPVIEPKSETGKGRLWLDITITTAEEAQ